MKELLGYIEVLNKDVNDNSSKIGEDLVQLAEKEGKWNEDFRYRLINNMGQMAENARRTMAVLEDLARVVESLKMTK